MFLSVWEKIMPCVYTYAYMDQKGVCCNMKTCVVFIWRGFERNLKKKIDIKIKNKLFFINSKLPGVSNCTFMCDTDVSKLLYLNE